jgi:hypothetical protein
MPWIFVGLVALGMAWYAVIRVRKPEIVEEVGTFEEEPVPPGTVHPHLAHHEEGAGTRPSAAADQPERLP